VGASQEKHKHDKGSWETWLGPMAVNLRELMHINLLYSGRDRVALRAISLRRTAIYLSGAASSLAPCTITQPSPCTLPATPHGRGALEPLTDCGACVRSRVSRSKHGCSQRSRDVTAVPMSGHSRGAFLRGPEGAASHTAAATGGRGAARKGDPHSIYLRNILLYTFPSSWAGSDDA